MNSVNLIGRLVQDPDLRYTPSGTAVASLRVAVDGAGPFISEDEGYQAGFFNVTVWGKQAENVNQYCFKGREIGITGRLQSRTYDSNKHDGERVYTVEVIADRVQFLREPQGVESAAPQQEPPKPAQSNARNGGRAPGNQASGQARTANGGRNRR